jgi:hypothetical protein
LEIELKLKFDFVKKSQAERNIATKVLNLTS